jgi:hypothetical protein
MIKSYTDFYEWLDECNKQGYNIVEIKLMENCNNSYILQQDPSHWDERGHCDTAVFSIKHNIGHILMNA